MLVIQKRIKGFNVMKNLFCIDGNPASREKLPRQGWVSTKDDALLKTGHANQLNESKDDLLSLSLD
jgi:hypothetical protein